MKNLFFFLITIIVSNSFCTAQNTTQYKWGSRPPLVFECDIFGNHEKKKIPVSPHSYFTITSRLNADTLIATTGLFGKIKDGILLTDEPEKFKQFNIKTEAKDGLLTKAINGKMTVDQFLEKQQYFLVPVSLLNTADAIPVFATCRESAQFTLGIASIPFKLRLHNFDFAKDLNIGSVLGFNMRTHPTRNNYINCLLNISISVNDIDEFSARNVPDDQLPAQNIAALTLASGLVWQFGKGQVGVFYGFDFMSHNNWVKYRWVYNKRPWVGIGFGINLFQKDDLSAGPGDEISNYKKKRR